AVFTLRVHGGGVSESRGEQTTKQTGQGHNGATGTDGTYSDLTGVENGSRQESQAVLAALGVQDASNLDGGGTAAMWIEGQYTVGPGRLLPNAILLTKP